MFGVPDFMYVPRERGDSAVPLRRFQSITTTTAAATVDATSDAVPGEDIWIVTNISVLLSAGAAQTSLRVAVGLRDSANADQVDILQELAPGNAGSAAVAVDGIQRSVWLPLMPGERINARGVFSAGANANTVVLGLLGVRINRGNWQFG